MAHWIKENPFKVGLSIVLLALAFLTFFFGKSPDDNFVTSLRSVSANLTSEILGAIIAIWIIDGLLKRHQEHSLRNIHRVIADKLRLSIYETSNQAINVIVDSKYGIVNLSEYEDLLQCILDYKANEALTHLEGLIGNLYYPPLDPIAYTEAKNIAREQQRAWTDFQIRFLPYLSLDQFASCDKIISRLKFIYKCSAEVDRSFQRTPDGIQKILPASQMAPQLVGEIKNLTQECLELLKTITEQST